MSDDRDAPELIAEAWRLMYVDIEHAGALGRLGAERARREGDTESEMIGLYFEFRRQRREIGHEAADPLMEQFAERMAALDVERGLWLTDDERGNLALSRGFPDVAISIGQRNDLIPEDERPPLERFVTVHLLCRATYEAGRFEESLGYSYRLLSAAESIGLDGHRALANGHMGCLHGEASNAAGARPYLEQAMALWRSAGATGRIAPATGNLMLVYHDLGLHELAYEALRTWLAQPGGVSREELHAQCDAVALAYLGVGELDNAEQALALGHYKGDPTQPHKEAQWTWAWGRVLCARSRFAEARDLCQSYIDGLSRRRVVEFPWDVYQLNDVIRVACEALGDAATAARAGRRAHAACVPLIGSSAQARYLSLQLEQQGYAKPPRVREIDRRRLAAIDRGVRQYSKALEAQPQPTPAPHVGASRQRSFVAHVSHEMRAPIGGVLGMTSLLLTSNLDERQRKFVSLARNSAETLLQLVNDILDIAKIESGKFDLDPRPFSIAKAAGEFGEMFQVLAQSKGLGFELTVDPLLPQSLIGDALRIRQVLTNLVSNAIKFTSSGKVRVSVMGRAGAAMNRCALRFEVRDTGRGISDEARKRLFTEFMQEDASTARQFGGTGLGLALCRQLVNLMDGEIGVESTLGKGSMFWVELELPLVRTALPTVQAR